MPLPLPSLRWPSLLIVHRYTLPAALHHVLHIGSLLDILVSVADVAGDFMPRLEGEGNDWDEAECEPFPDIQRQVVSDCFTGGQLLEAG